MVVVTRVDEIVKSSRCTLKMGTILLYINYALIKATFKNIYNVSGELL